MMQSVQNSFILYADSIEEIQLLTMEQRGLLLTTAFFYVNSLSLPELDQATSVLWQTWKKNIDRNARKWEEARQRRSAAGRKGGLAAHRQNTTPVSNAEPGSASEAVTGTDTVTDTDTVTETVTPAISPPRRETYPDEGNADKTDFSSLDHFGTVL